MFAALEYALFSGAALDDGATMATPDDVERFDAHANAVETYWKRELAEGGAA